jgi:hypothetical protein
MRRGPSRIRGIALGAVLVAASGCVGEAQRGTSPSGSVPVVTPGQAYGPFPYAAPAQRATFDAFLACAADLGVEYEGPFADSNGEGLFFRLAPGEEASHAQQRHVDRACPEFDVGAFGTRVGRLHVDRFERAATAFARCMQRHGVAGFPTPSFGGGDPIESFWALPFSWPNDRFTSAVRSCVDPLQSYLFG